MKTLFIDIETYSSVPLKTAGTYPYAESDDFEILLFGYSEDNEPVRVVDLASGEKLPERVLNALIDNDVQKWAYNAAFERVCISYWLRKYYPKMLNEGYLDPNSWRCSMVWAGYMGLPLSLEGAGAVLKLDNQKMTEGKNLIRYFCCPCNPTKTNGGRTRNLPSHAPEKWELFKEYNQRDVEVEMAIHDRLAKYPVPDFVWDEYHLDQVINDRGILIDMDVVENAIVMDNKSHNEIESQLKVLTDMENPNSVAQMKAWLLEHGLEVDSLGKKAVAELIETAPEEIKPILKLRQKLAKSSVKKYTAMRDCICKDNRARGMFFFYGANRTGRWSGRKIQLQNLPQNHIPDLENARNLLKDGNYDAIDMLFGDIPDTLSQLVRTAFIPKAGCRFIVADFSAIEARVLSHLADEQWRVDVFEQGGDIYCASASQMFGVPVVKHGVNGHLRQKGKIAELALGYGGSVGALKAMGAIEMGLKEDELQPLVNSWRDANPNIVELWWAVDRAVKTAIKERTTTETHGIKFEYRGAMLLIHLPSGRHLSYVKPRIGENQFGGESVTYEGTGESKKWMRLESYGPKFVENIVQAISRDILAASMSRLSGYSIVAHVHDEVIIEADSDDLLDEVCTTMGRTPWWIKGLNLRADGYECNFYMKD